MLAIAIILVAAYLVLSLYENNDDFDNDKNNNKREVNIKEYSVSISKEGSGTVTGAGSYLLGNTIEITATPDTEYRFTGWYKNNELCSNNSIYKLYIDSNCDFMAKFERISHNVDLKENGAPIPGY